MARITKNNDPIFIGIDPGLTGAVAIIHGKSVELIDTPIYKVKKSVRRIDKKTKKKMIKKNMKKEYLPAEMADTICVFSHRNKKVIVTIENVHSMPGQGVTSMFNFGRGFGMWLGILAALKLWPPILVAPQTWKKEMMAGMSKEKKSALLRACQLFPAMASQLTKAAHIGRADALLMAAYGKKVHK